MQSDAYAKTNVLGPNPIQGQAAKHRNTTFASSCKPARDRPVRDVRKEKFCLHPWLLLGPQWATYYSGTSYYSGLYLLLPKGL